MRSSTPWHSPSAPAMVRPNSSRFKPSFLAQRLPLFLPSRAGPYSAPGALAVSGGRRNKSSTSVPQSAGHHRILLLFKRCGGVSLLHAGHALTFSLLDGPALLPIFPGRHFSPDSAIQAIFSSCPGPLGGVIRGRFAVCVGRPQASGLSIIPAWQPFSSSPAGASLMTTPWGCLRAVSPRHPRRRRDEIECSTKSVTSISPTTSREPPPDPALPRRSQPLQVPGELGFWRPTQPALSDPASY